MPTPHRSKECGFENDPVEAQYTPSAAESCEKTKDESADPIGDEKHTVTKGLVHRYPDRVLLKITDTCYRYCRFCFRKEMVGKGDGALSEKDIDQAISYVKNNHAIHEVILSGGDPFTLSNRKLKRVLNQLDMIDHLDNIRIHTRTALVKPERINEELLDIIQSISKPLYIVLHINHANELTPAVLEKIKLLASSDVSLLAQSVLLKGINDSVEALENLMRTLIRNRIKPYYLHHLDHAPGTSHFRVPIQEGQKLYAALKAKISGIALPSYVLDIPDGYGKIPINQSYILCSKGNKHIVLDHENNEHIYID